MNDNIYSPEYVQELFNRMSGSYERMNYITSFGFSIHWRNQFLRHLLPTQNHIQVIDLMAGMGEIWDALSSLFPNAQITALDFSSEMLKRAQVRNENHFNNSVLILQQDILNNELPSNCYDVVVCAFGLKTFDESQLLALATETKRILKPGGQFSFVEVSKPENRTLSLLYGFYLGNIIPILGKLFLGNPSEYRMLWRYITKFRSTNNSVRIFQRIGLLVTAESYFWGCATGFFGQKSHLERNN